MRVLMTGSSGLIGSALRRSLAADGAEVVRLVRRPPAAPDERHWDPAKGELEVDAVEGFDVVVHLAGAGIGDSRWSDERKKVLVESRTLSTRLLAEKLASARVKPDVLLSGSAIGFYGESTRDVTEKTGPASPPDFLSDLCVAWEAAASSADAAGIRTVYLRSGMVLTKEGGALKKMLFPFQMGVGGRLGTGDDWWSWISLDDHIRAMRHLMEKPVEGPVNVTAPNPVTSGEFTTTLGKVLRRPTVLPTPRFGLNVLLGKELADALLFTSARVLPNRLEESGFSFQHPDVESALRAALGKP